MVKEAYSNSFIGSPQPGVRFSAVMDSPSVATKAKTPNTLNKTTDSALSAFLPVRPIPLTPGVTPRAASQGLVVLSPGRTITETLNALASSTARQLEEIWDEVGYTPQERASQLSDLLVKFRDQCEQKVAEEKAVAETFRQTISDSKAELKTLGSALKAMVDPHLLRKDTGLTLTDELSNLESSLDLLRADAETAISDLRDCNEYLLESHQALGRGLDKKWEDIRSDLTMHRREAFHGKVAEMKEEISTRTDAVIQLIQDCQTLMDALGIEGHGSESLLDRRIASSLIRSKDSSFIMSSKFETDTCTGISATAMEELTTRVAELSKEKRRRKNMLQDMGGEIALLWEQLDISGEDQKEFTESVKGLGMDTIEKGKTELQRLKLIKSTMLGKLIDDARTSIRELWDETNASETLRKQFSALHVTEESSYDDDLLDQHNAYIRDLQERLETMRPILRTIERREDIIRQRMEYDELQKDSHRLNQRGAAMAKQLQEEERMALRIKKSLPKLTRILEEKLEEWKASTGEDFQYNQQVYAETMIQQEDEWLQYKKNETQMKLKKKQEQHNWEENKFLGKNPGPKKKFGTRPLGDMNQQRSTSRIRSRETVKPRRTNQDTSRARSALP